MFNPTFRHFLLAGLCMSLFLTACEEETTDPKDPNNPSGTVGDTVVLREGKGFSQLALFASAGLNNRQGVNNGISDSYEPYDMSITQTGDTLNLIVMETMGLQQSAMTALIRHRFNPETKAMLPAPEGDLSGLISYMGNNQNESRYGNPTNGFVEGSAKFYASKITFNNFGQGTATMAGDVSYSRGPTSFIRTPRVAASGNVVEDILPDNFQVNGSIYENRFFWAYTPLRQPTITYSWGRRIHQDDLIRGGAVEPTGSGLSAANPHYLFLASKRKLYVAQAPAINPTNGGPVELTFLDSLPLTTGIDWNGPPTVRVRNPKGSNEIGLLVANGGSTPHFFSASFNKTTGKLTPNIAGIQIPNLQTGGVNFDIDPLGNMYFDNYGNNFQTDSTISIYKASGNTFSLVGQDNILKSGSVRMVRWYNGKVYAGVSYNWRVTTNGVQGMRNHRIAVIRAD